MSHKQSSLGSPFHACKWQGNRLLTECQVNSHYSRLSHQWKVGTDMYEFRDRTNYTFTYKFNLNKTSYISSSRVILLFLVISQCKPKTRTRTRYVVLYTIVIYIVQYIVAIVATTATTSQYIVLQYNNILQLLQLS